MFTKFTAKTFYSFTKEIVEVRQFRYITILIHLHISQDNKTVLYFLGYNIMITFEPSYLRLC